MTLAGRIRLPQHGKLAFSHIEDGSGRIQLMLRVNEIGAENLKYFTDLFDLGDFIQATGSLMRSKTGEVTLLVKNLKCLLNLSPCCRPPKMNWWTAKSSGMPH